ncbi:hypothetical protein BpHYR1_041416 [Brachionus plicatilis]|uniref:Uncharacterized protein n=1 Tax=Brachionus plicatilis TaxID=10195 RepID=A0A3M7PTP2_BRAPC|nr:hypothetical protein BpHYR1_041416 [Brachionus plicatilis]
MGITNFRAQNQIKTDHPIDYSVRSDADAAKSSFDLLVKSSCKKGIKGFIQEISRSPFSMNIYSEIQLRMWDSIQKNNPVGILTLPVFLFLLFSIKKSHYYIQL